MKYAFIRDTSRDYPVRTLCDVMQVHRSGYYAWCRSPKSKRQKRDELLSPRIKQSWLESGGVYGYRKIHDDLREWGYAVGVNRVHRIMRQEGIKSERGYHRRKGYYTGPKAPVADNRLNRDFDPIVANRAWVTDITQIRTYEGWLYLAVVIDLYSRRVIGWSMQKTMHVDIVLQALIAAVWKRKPAQQVLVHSDQGSQYTSGDWQSFLRDHNLVCSMSRRGNCHDNAVAESFFGLLKRERIRRKIYQTRDDARRDIFEYIELFYNSKRKHSNNGMLSPNQFELHNRVV